MSKEKFSIIGPNGEEVGFAIIDLPRPETTFEHVASGALIDGPIADVALLFGSLVGFTGAGWLAFGPGPAAPLTGIAVTAALAGIKAWRGGWPLPDLTPDPEPTNNIKVTMTDNDGATMYLDYFYDGNIEVSWCRELARLIVANDLQWAGRDTACRETSLSQPQFNRLRAEFVKQEYIHENGNHTTLTRRGRAFVQTIADRPAPRQAPGSGLLAPPVTTNNNQQGGNCAKF